MVKELKEMCRDISTSPHGAMGVKKNAVTKFRCSLCCNRLHAHMSTHSGGGVGVSVFTVSIQVHAGCEGQASKEVTKQCMAMAVTTGSSAVLTYEDV